MICFITMNLLIFVALMVILARLRRPGISLAQQILAGLVLGVRASSSSRISLPVSKGVLDGTLEWTNVVGSTYINLLMMITTPLVLVMMISTVIRMREVAALGRIGGSVIGILIGTTVVAALVGIAVASLFGLSAEGLTEGARELARASVLEGRRESVAELGFADMLVRFVPSNIFEDLTGARPTSIIAVVVFGILFGIAALQVSKDDEARGAAIRRFIETALAIVMKLVRLIMAFTPYGILALMTKVVAGSNANDILSLLTFVLASYIAIAIMFAVHALLLALNGVNVVHYAKQVWPVLVCVFVAKFGGERFR
ncbi:MAG: cation:dicarboxylase symporter family transporter [Woeseiaceae bacterium]|nr:cation:dicarboxylase symporter family transporter [Woeseiaceae bacterium]